MANEQRVFGVDDLPELLEIYTAGEFERLEGHRVAPDKRHAPKSWNPDMMAEQTMNMRQCGPIDAVAFGSVALTPFMRRLVDFEKNYGNWRTLWANYESLLLKELNTRWLVSSLDTMIKDPKDDVEHAWAFCGAFFAKTMKLYETEELRLEDYPELLDEPRRGDINRMYRVYGQVKIFDGMTPFNLSGSGDMIEKMERRLLGAKSDALSYRITCELWRRAHAKQTVYKRIADALKRREQLDKEKEKLERLAASALSAPVVDDFAHGEEVLTICTPSDMVGVTDLSIAPSSLDGAAPADREVILGTGENARVLLTVVGVGDKLSLDDIKLIDPDQ